MRWPLTFTVLTSLVLAGCLPLSTYYREGASVARLDRDTLNCEVAALQAAPVANQTRITPPEWVPAREVCNSAGACSIRPGYFLPGETYTVDVNRPLRKRVELQCMADKGYAPVKIPPCPDRISRAAPAGATTTLPKLSSKSCVIKNQNGTFQIVNKS